MDNKKNHIFNNKCSIWFVILLIFLLIPNYIRADSGKDFFSFFHSLEGERVENYPVFSIWSGISECNDNFLTKNQYPKNEQTFAPLFNYGIEYGFKRYISNRDYKNLFLHSGERVFLESTSAGMKPSSLKFDGLTIDGWKFGFSTDNGFGLFIDKKNINSLEFHHQTSFVWNRFDFENFNKYNIIEPRIHNFDEKYKFGIDYSTMLSFSLFQFATLDLQYQRSLIYPDFQFGSWFGSFILENALQRAPDFFDKVLYNKLGKEYFIYKFIYNSLVSFLYSEIKKEHSFAPFSSDPSLTLQSINLRITFVPIFTLN